MTNEPIQLLRQAFGDVRRLSRTSRGWLMSAPHREDKKPSFTVFQGSDGNWVTHDFATGETMSLQRYLKEYGGISVAAYTPKGTSSSEVKPKAVSPSPELVSWIEETGADYEGHGFKNETDSRALGVFKLTVSHPTNKKLAAGNVAIIVRDETGKVTGIKVRNKFNVAKGKYVWAESGYENPLWYSPNFISRADEIKSVIVVEGELKAAMVYHAVKAMFIEHPDLKGWDNVGVIGVPGISSYDKVIEPLMRYDRVLFITDMGVLNELANQQTWKLQHAWQVLTLAGKTVKVVGWETFANEYKAKGRDINDFVGDGFSPTDIIQVLVSHARRPQMAEKYLLENMPVLTLKNPLASVLMAHYVAAMTGGKWINGSGVEHSLTQGKAMYMTKLTPRVLRKARKELKELGVLSKRTSDPVPDGFVLNMKRFRELMLTNHPGGTANETSVPNTNTSTSLPTKKSLSTTERYFRLFNVYFVPSIAYFSPYEEAKYERYLSRILARLGYTKRDIAKLLDVTEQTVHNWFKFVVYKTWIDMKPAFKVLRKELNALIEHVMKVYGHFVTYKPDKPKHTTPFLEVVT